MAGLAYDSEHPVDEELATPSRPRSETRIRTHYGCSSEMAHTVESLDAWLRSRADRGDAGIVTWLRMVQIAAADVERWSRALGAHHVTESWLEALVDWMSGVSDTLTSAYAYEGAQRRMALELVAEESSMRLMMRLEREGAEAVAMLRVLDRNASHAASELVARVDLADRMLHALALEKAG